ncbi:hypothetical protein D187_005976 [Cystobacter fuscus DSM 2262]|uniref:PEGA domain-containing protein n=1 Tax=Cystobacter fuscus (strain ATCC 25194 / DSM 2262 / NBRC 100088 / M29) TaxID=1242864 RepID=S9QQL5_CYSF2|nr:hypothetical protein [Cystobacter fuscus]EPX63569.1 hypothetical protein D187_005976 [Cystobacter fuscus DSM 2262]
MRALCLLLLLLAPSAFAAEGTTLRIRCVETCTVLLEGKPGRRLHDAPWDWEFKDVAPGKRRLEVKGFLGRSLATRYLDIPDVPETSVYVDAKGGLLVSPRESSSPKSGAGSRPVAPVARKKEAGSILHVRCQKSCSVAVDHVRRPSDDGRTAIVHGLVPGTHQVEAELLFGGGVRRASIEVPPASEVFVYAAGSGLQVTNTRPLGKRPGHPAGR